ncbi:MAG: PTS sugar transporter subunit IIA [Planctomycetes bacterium]|nr:PTS sugar transporter subunit IIA [Planctomycetota bacterium]
MLTVREAARLLNVPESQILRWVSDEGLNAVRVGDQYRFHKVELLEWVTSHKGTRRVSVSTEIFRTRNDQPEPRFADALEVGGIHHRVPGDTVESALRSVVSRMRLPESVNREEMVQLLVSREKLGSTAIGDGIAIPHVRQPLTLHGARPAITLCFLEIPLPYTAKDGEAVRALFTVIAPTIRTHLLLLSRLAAALNDTPFRTLVARQAPAGEILREAKRLESAESSRDDV